MSNLVKCECLLCKPIPGHVAHPLYGFDLDAVPDIQCLRCKEPIGEEPYVLETGTARFGQMFVLHQRCAEGKWAPKGSKKMPTEVLQHGKEPYRHGAEREC